MKPLITLSYVFLALCTCLSPQVSGTPGQVLDAAFDDLKSNVTSLWEFTENLQQKYDKLAKDIALIKIVHGKCMPCVNAKSLSPEACDCTYLEPKKDCLEFFQQGIKRSGIYRLKSDKFSSIANAYCDQTTQGGGWTIIQRRRDGNVDFNRPWKDYKNGFGDLNGDFWFGNDLINQLTSGKSDLLINMKMRNAKKPVYAKYGNFQVSDEKSKYKLTISGFTGTTKREGMTYMNGMKFTTKDADNDKHGKNCAKVYSGGWWFNNCFYANLNGKLKANAKADEIYWYHPSIQPTFVEMKVRRKM